MERWRIHYKDSMVSDWMGTEALYDCIWGAEELVLYIEKEDMKPHIDKVLELMERGISAVGQWGETLAYREGHYYIDDLPVMAWEIRAALQVRYTVDPEDYIEDIAFVEQMVAGSPL